MSEAHGSQGGSWELVWNPVCKGPWAHRGLHRDLGGGGGRV